MYGNDFILPIDRNLSLITRISEHFCLPVPLSWEAWIEPVMSILSILCLAPELPGTTGLVRVPQA